MKKIILSIVVFVCSVNLFYKSMASNLPLTAKSESNISPWLVTLALKDGTKGTGVIIGKKWILTTAHMVYEIKNKPDHLNVYTKYLTLGMKSYLVKQINIFPDYTLHDCSTDLAILELEKSMDLNEETNIIPYAKDNSILSYGISIQSVSSGFIFNDLEDVKLVEFSNNLKFFEIDNELPLVNEITNDQTGICTLGTLYINYFQRSVKQPALAVIRLGGAQMRSGMSGGSLVSKSLGQPCLIGINSINDYLDELGVFLQKDYMGERILTADKYPAIHLFSDWIKQITGIEGVTSSTIQDWKPPITETNESMISATGIGVGLASILAVGIAFKAYKWWRGEPVAVHQPERVRNRGRRGRRGRNVRRRRNPGCN